MTQLHDELVNFLISAKLSTYASQGDAASVPPLLVGGRQYEFRQGAWFYRDIYFGMAYFIGQEMVYQEDQPFWSMVYGGGMLSSQPSAQEMERVYGFLQAALRKMEPEHPYRGPRIFRLGDLEYQNDCQGTVHHFWGVETINWQGSAVYQLRYSGGLIR